MSYKYNISQIIGNVNKYIPFYWEKRGRMIDPEFGKRFTEIIEKSGISFIAFYIDFRRFYSSLLCNGIRMLFPCINPEVTLEYFFTDTHTIIVLDNHVYSCMSAQNVLHPEYYNIYFPVDLCNNQFFARCPVWVYIRAVQIHFLAFSSFD